MSAPESEKPPLGKVAEPDSSREMKDGRSPASWTATVEKRSTLDPLQVQLFEADIASRVQSRFTTRGQRLGVWLFFFVPALIVAVLADSLIWDRISERWITDQALLGYLGLIALTFCLPGYWLVVLLRRPK